LGRGSARPQPDGWLAPAESENAAIAQPQRTKRRRFPLFTDAYKLKEISAYKKPAIWEGDHSQTAGFLVKSSERKEKAAACHGNN